MQRRWAVVLWRCLCFSLNKTTSWCCFRWT
uniref:Uncharacterized protein n=1 Tax=Rhizophora mucronata TaxID=61149 RepID=A0A2P2ND80_RHIMU